MNPLRFLFALACPAAHAQEIGVYVNPERAEAAGLDADSVEGKLRAAMAEGLKLDDATEYLEQMANAGATSAKGMGADYASRPQRFVFGMSAGTAADRTSWATTREGAGLPGGGFAFQASVMGGVNLGLSAPDDNVLRRFVLYGNGGAYSNRVEPFGASMYTFGTHFQVELVRPPPGGATRWGGIALTSGVEVSHYALELATDLPLSSGKATWDATGSYLLTANTVSTPIELSTSMKVVFFSIYGGAALDFVPTGQATAEVALEGDISAEVEGDAYPIGTAKVQAETSGSAAAQIGRMFGGFQLDILALKLYGQVNVVGAQSLGMHAGARFAI